MPRGFLEALGIEPAPQARRSVQSHGGRVERTVFPSYHPCKTERSAKPPIARPACRRSTAIYQLRFTTRIDPDCQRCRLRLLSLLRKTRISGALVAWLTCFARLPATQRPARLECYHRSFHLGFRSSTQASLRVGSRRLSNADTSCPRSSPGTSDLVR